MLLNSRTIQSPKGKFLIGNAADLARNPLRFFQSLAKDYGEIARIRIGNRSLFLVNHPEYIREILVLKPQSFRKGRALQLSRPVLGEGLLTSEGETHSRHRRMMQPAFHMRKIGEFADTMVEYAILLTEKWHSGEIRNISSDMMDVTLSIIAKTMFGYETPEETNQISHAIEVLSESVIRSSNSVIRMPSFIPTRRQKQFRNARETLDSTIYQIISARRKEEQRDFGDLLSMLLQARDETDGQALNDKELRDQVMTIFLAGHETTANTLSWTWYLLAKHPEIEAKFHEELDVVLQGRKPSISDLSSLSYTNRVIKESMRLYPAAWTLDYEAIEDVQIGDWKFRKGDGFFMSQYVMHRNPIYFTDPDQFNPDRWTDEFVRSIPQFAYFPFGGGPRTCIGNQFALMEAALLLAAIGQRYRLELVAQKPVVPMPLITLRPKHGIQMRLIQKN